MWQTAAQLIRPSNLDRVDAGAREPDDLGFDDLIGVGILGKFDTTIFDLLSTGSTESLAYYLLPGNFDVRCARFIASRCTHLSYHFRQQRRDHPVAHRFARSYADVETATPQVIPFHYASKKPLDVCSVNRFSDICCDRVHESGLVNR